MSAINESVFVEIMGNREHPLRNTLCQQLHFATQRDYSSDLVPEHIRNAVDRDACIGLLDRIKDFVVTHGFAYGKYLRPYTFDTFPYLNREEAWWGFEFETGYTSTSARSTAVEAAYELGINGVTFDAEGEGSFVSEVTFSPSELSTYQNGIAPAYRFIEFLDQNPELVGLTDWDMIGTHLNLSHPAITQECEGVVAQTLNNAIHCLPFTAEVDGQTVNVREHLFGRRRLYKGALRRGGWIEMKLFRTTYELEVFKRYMRTAEALTRAALATAENYAAWNHTMKHAVTNLWEMFLDPTVEPQFASSYDYSGSYTREWLAGDHGLTPEPRFSTELVNRVSLAELIETTIPQRQDDLNSQYENVWFTTVSTEGN